ncbi:matrixin family metalloprotease [Tenacibaculum aiptasiae]|nr:matrixin family metalloprotease [Tenacibaculum aiptasiae]
MNGIREIFSLGVMEWKDAVPVKFSERYDAWDFEIIIKKDNCDYMGCTLASAFFPDSGRHQLVIYPKMFTQSKQEQIETIAHELGHVFGLRHFFAEIREQDWPSVKFGKHKPFSIMNYGSKSIMTENDIADLKLLYNKVWNGELREINGTPIRTFFPYHMSGDLV